MIHIFVEKNATCKIAFEGSITSCLPELGVGLERFISKMVEDCPKGCEELTRKLVKSTINFAVDEAFDNLK